MREESGMTQVELAKKLGVNQSTVSKLEKGLRRADLIQIRTIGKHLGFSLIEFVEQLEKEIRKSAKSRRK
jgi:transcriptional regulator with XRE-family HTH domain